MCALLVNLLGEDGHNHVRVGLVEVVAAGDELLLVGGLGCADEQVPVGGAAGEFEELVEFEHAPLTAGVALGTYVVIRSVSRSAYFTARRRRRRAPRPQHTFVENWHPRMEDTFPVLIVPAPAVIDRIAPVALTLCAYGHHGAGLILLQRLLLLLLWGCGRGHGARRGLVLRAIDLCAIRVGLGRRRDLGVPLAGRAGAGRLCGGEGGRGGRVLAGAAGGDLEEFVECEDLWRGLVGVRGGDAGRRGEVLGVCSIASLRVGERDCQQCYIYVK